MFLLFPGSFCSVPLLLLLASMPACFRLCKILLIHQPVCSILHCKIWGWTPLARPTNCCAGNHTIRSLHIKTWPKCCAGAVSEKITHLQVCMCATSSWLWQTSWSTWFRYAGLLPGYKSTSGPACCHSAVSVLCLQMHSFGNITLLEKSVNCTQAVAEMAYCKLCKAAGASCEVASTLCACCCLQPSLGKLSTVA